MYMLLHCNCSDPDLAFSDSSGAFCVAWNSSVAAQLPRTYTFTDDVGVCMRLVLTPFTSLVCLQHVIRLYMFALALQLLILIPYLKKAQERAHTAWDISHGARARPPHICCATWTAHVAATCGHCCALAPKKAGHSAAVP